jgi:hypothetical protein
VVRAAGQALVFNGRGHSIADWAWALRNLRQDSLTLVKLQGEGLQARSGGYEGEALDAKSREFLAAVRSHTVDAFMAANTNMINRDK